MKMSEKIDELGKALAKAQAEVGTAHKDSKNPFFNSKYADLTSVMDACKTAFNKYGLSIIQGVDTTEKGNQVTTTIVHESGQFISSSMSIVIDKNNMQGLGSAITYARRYGLQAMCFVGADDDDGNEASKKPTPQKFKTQPATNEQKTVLMKLIQDTKGSVTVKTEEWVDGLNTVEIENNIKQLEKESGNTYMRGSDVN